REEAHDTVFCSMLPPTIKSRDGNIGVIGTAQCKNRARYRRAIFHGVTIYSPDIGIKHSKEELKELLILQDRGGSAAEQLHFLDALLPRHSRTTWRRCWRFSGGDDKQRWSRAGSFEAPCHFKCQDCSHAVTHKRIWHSQ